MHEGQHFSEDPFRGEGPPRSSGVWTPIWEMLCPLGKIQPTARTESGPPPGPAGPLHRLLLYSQGSFSRHPYFKTQLTWYFLQVAATGIDRARLCMGSPPQYLTDLCYCGSTTPHPASLHPCTKGPSPTLSRSQSCGTDDRLSPAAGGAQSPRLSLHPRVLSRTLGQAQRPRRGYLGSGGGTKVRSRRELSERLVVVRVTQVAMAVGICKEGLPLPGPQTKSC